MYDDEIEQLRRAIATYCDDVITQLGAYVGPRSLDIP
jgi:hypothetical protein